MTVNNNNSPIQDYVHPDDQTQPLFEMTPGFKPFTICIYFQRNINKYLYLYQLRENLQSWLKLLTWKTSWKRKMQYAVQKNCSFPAFYCRFHSILHNLFKKSTIERFSFECRKVIGFALSTRCDWLKRFAPPFHPIRSKTKANCDAPACIFPRFASATCNYFEFWLVQCIVCVLRDWPE